MQHQEGRDLGDCTGSSQEGCAQGQGFIEALKREKGGLPESSEKRDTWGGGFRGVKQSCTAFRGGRGGARGCTGVPGERRWRAAQTGGYTKRGAQGGCSRTGVGRGTCRGAALVGGCLEERGRAAARGWRATSRRGDNTESSTGGDTERGGARFAERGARGWRALHVELPGERLTGVPRR